MATSVCIDIYMGIYILYMLIVILYYEKKCYVAKHNTHKNNLPLVQNPKNSAQ